MTKNIINFNDIDKNSKKSNKGKGGEARGDYISLDHVFMGTDSEEKMEILKKARTKGFEEIYRISDALDELLLELEDVTILPKEFSQALEKMVKDYTEEIIAKILRSEEIPQINDEIYDELKRDLLLKLVNKYGLRKP